MVDIRVKFDLKKIAKKHFPKHYRKFKYSLSSGKRIRPKLIEKACIRHNKDVEEIENLVYAVELFHNASLMHDDILDEDSIRRDSLSYHKKFNTKDAVIFGDYLSIISLDILNKFSREILDEFISAMKEVVLGILMEEEKIDSLDAYYDYIYHKTASLFVFCMRGPLIHFNIKDDPLIKFAKEFGEIYQIHNDLCEVKKEKNTILNFMEETAAKEELNRRINHLNSLDVFKLDEFGDFGI